MMKFLPLVVLSVLLSSCGASVAVDYDKNANFSQYNTYNYFPEIASGLNELDNKRIIMATDSLLQQRGFVKSEDPQLYINFFARESVAASQNTIGFGVGSGGGNMGVGVGGGIPIGGRQITQQFTMDFIDVNSDDLIWQAVAEADYKEKIKPEQKEAYYMALIEKILKKYPPK